MIRSRYVPIFDISADIVVDELDSEHPMSQKGMPRKRAMSAADRYGRDNKAKKTQPQVISRNAIVASSSSAPGANAHVQALVQDQKFCDLSADLDAWLQEHNRASDPHVSPRGEKRGPIPSGTGAGADRKTNCIASPRQFASVCVLAKIG